MFATVIVKVTLILQFFLKKGNVAKLSCNMLFLIEYFGTVARKETWERLDK